MLSWQDIHVYICPYSVTKSKEENLSMALRNLSGYYIHFRPHKLIQGHCVRAATLFYDISEFKFMFIIIFFLFSLLLFFIFSFFYFSSFLFFFLQFLFFFFFVYSFIFHTSWKKFQARVLGYQLKGYILNSWNEIIQCNKSLILICFNIAEHHRKSWILASLGQNQSINFSI